ncbi:MAG: 50S ribosomal protein L15 [Ignavibacteriales bacterium]|nr:50S ribosomal protein L15 [Ignavibacteriales bacterium]
MANSTLHNLAYAPGSKKRIKRIARGQGSGHGGTATRGHKGEGARSGTHYRPWFEGGQMPLIRRVPKFGFTNVLRVEYQKVNVSQLQELAPKFKDGKVTPEAMYTVGAISKKSKPVKVLGDGEIKTKLEITAHSFSKTAVQKIEAAGGKAITLNQKSK